MPENSGNAGPGCWPRPIPAEQSNPPRVKLVQATGEDGRTAIGGILYTFLSAYRRLAPSGLRRFILRSPSRGVRWPHCASVTPISGCLATRGGRRSGNFAPIATDRRCGRAIPRLPLSTNETQFQLVRQRRVAPTSVAAGEPGAVCAHRAENTVLYQVLAEH